MNAVKKGHSAGSAKSQVEFTIFEKSDGPLSKVISWDADTQSVKPRAAGKMSRGKARRAVADVEGFAALIGSLEPNQAITLGVLRKGLPDEVKVTIKGLLKGVEGIVARDKDHVVYHKGKPAFALIDYDQKGKPAAIEVGDFWNILCVVLPALREAAHVIRRSTSAGLYHGEQALPSSGGWHIYVIVKDGTDTERFLNALHDRCWLAGFGWWMISEAGSLLERSIIDRAVHASERLVFEGAPVVKPPLRQDAAMRRPSFFHGCVVDTRAVCPDLTAAEQKKVNQLKSNAHGRMQRAADLVKAAYIEERAQEFIKRCGISIEDARQKVKVMTENEMLPSEWLLEFESLGQRTVADVLNNPYFYHNLTLADPIEGKKYQSGLSCAKVYVRSNGVPWIKSFAHGGKSYTLVSEGE